MDINSRLDRSLAKNAATERMDGADKAAVDMGKRLEEFCFLLARSFAGRFFQADLEATANFSRRFPREGHRGEGIDRKMPTGKQVDHPLDHRRGLSRPGSGLDEDRCRELGADGVALRLIAEGFCRHHFLPRFFLGRSSRMGTSSGLSS